jgi:hypothetical protein
MSIPDYAELQVTSHFSFLRGASSCEELFVQAYQLGIQALAVVDRNSLAGIVRAHQAAKETGVRLIVGCRLDLDDGMSSWSIRSTGRPIPVCAGSCRWAKSAAARPSASSAGTIWSPTARARSPCLCRTSPTTPALINSAASKLPSATAPIWR